MQHVSLNHVSLRRRTVVIIAPFLLSWIHSNQLPPHLSSCGMQQSLLADPNDCRSFSIGCQIVRSGDDI